MEQEGLEEEVEPRQREIKQTDTNQAILRQLEELRATMNDSNRRGGGRMKLVEATEEAERSPFSHEILQAPFPTKFTLPIFSSIFDGTRNAIQHMKSYNLTLLQWLQYKAVMCKYFPMSLTREALSWFDNLHEGSITSFAQLQRLFLENYISNNLLRAGIETAFDLKKAHGESLRSLTACWRTKCGELAGRVSERYLILVFINSMYATDLLYIEIFRLKDKLTMQELREYHEEYIALEEKKWEMEINTTVITAAKERRARLIPRMAGSVECTGQGRLVKENTVREVALSGHDKKWFGR
ncbi:uncharacterized protein LOC113272368 [Papaver somniferum]|uniref:uncharacterized protein LOC113272368 n=1 Tax=Papaver somniferum TaxID=3469 RepID=UPI000E6F52E9|nr:uncharacterized protein LOC113272368 [Papaver somniferum]